MENSKMMAQQLLQYLPQYHVIVCTKCHFALPPRAVLRHLRDFHKILRSQRKPFLDYIARLDLWDHDRLNEIKHLNHPVPGLPLHKGFRCIVSGCEYLCISEKRIRSHIASQHQGEVYDVAQAERVQLQTFFSGNALRYFTVESNTFADETRHWLENSRHKPQLVLPRSIGAALGTKLEHLDRIDKDLLQHYALSTSMSIATCPYTEQLWKTAVLVEAQDHTFMLHSLIACAALHLAHLNQTRRRELVIRGRSHQAIAMPLFRTAIASVNTSNSNAVLAFSHLLILYFFATDTDEEDHLPFRTGISTIVPSWLYFLRTGCTVFYDVFEEISNGPMRELMLIWEKEVNTPVNSCSERLHAFLDAIPRSDSPHAWSTAEIVTFREASKALDSAFMVANVQGDTITTWDILREWPLRISEHFMEMLGALHPGALILLAHYAELLRRIESQWYIGSCATRLIHSVARRLDRKWHPYIQDLL